jgi:hypothetical protein
MSVHTGIWIPAGDDTVAACHSRIILGSRSMRAALPTVIWLRFVGLGFDRRFPAAP